MKTEFAITRHTHQLLLEYFKNYSAEQLNKIPDGFRNNLIWNIGHIIVSQQALVYKGSGQPMKVSNDLVALYARGSKPDRDITAEEMDELKILLVALPMETEADYKAGLFSVYNARLSEMGYTLDTVEDAIAFNNHHEALHFGIMMQLRKFV